MEHRTETLAMFATLSGLGGIDRLIQRGRDPQTARFSLQMTDGRVVHVGTIATLWSQSELGKACAVALGIVPKPIKASDWRSAIGALIAYATDVIETPGESFEDTVHDWVTRYSARVATTNDRDGAAAIGAPFVDDGDLHISANELARYVRREYSEQVKLTELRQALTDLDFERVTVNYSRGKKRSSTSYYRLPIERLHGAA